MPSRVDGSAFICKCNMMVLIDVILAKLMPFTDNTRDDINGVFYISVFLYNTPVYASQGFDHS